YSTEKFKKCPKLYPIIHSRTYFKASTNVSTRTKISAMNKLFKNDFSSHRDTTDCTQTNQNQILDDTGSDKKYIINTMDQHIDILEPIKKKYKRHFDDPMCVYKLCKTQWLVIMRKLPNTTTNEARCN